MEYNIYQCPQCKRYRMDDASWEHPSINDFAIMLLHKKQIELHLTLCEDCDSTERRGM